MKLSSSSLFCTIAALATVASAQQIQTFTSLSGLSLQYLQVANGSSHDLRMRIRAPTSAEWNAFGIGDDMEGALMFVLYPSQSNSSRATVSVRSAESHIMPTPLGGVDYRVISSSISDNTAEVDLACYSCVQWQGGSLNTQSTNAPFIWAQGPSQAMRSDDNAAPIQYHQNNYGHFQVNAAASNFPADTPASPFIPTGAAASETMSTAAQAAAMEKLEYTYTLVHVHAILFCLAWGLFAPVALLLVRGINVRAHYMLQTLVVLMSISAFGVAVYFSTLIPRPIIRNYETYHQGIGIFVFSASIVQALGGALQHILFKRGAKAHHAKISANGNDISPSMSSASEIEKTHHTVVKNNDSAAAAPHTPYKKPSGLVAFSQVHMWFGRIIMILGAMNAPFGFHLIGWNNYAIGVGVAEGVVVLTCLIVSGIWGWRIKSKAA